MQTKSTVYRSPFTIHSFLAALISDNKPEKALLLYQYYTNSFPKIVVA